jgi:D-sedoheptulose 7-phosphate isomerase
MIETARERFLQSARLKEEMARTCGEIVVQIAKSMIQALASGGKILLCGNGGSAADCQHFAGEMVGRFKIERKGLPAIALSTDTSVLTSLANDYQFEIVFSRQVEALGKQGDILIAFSTSGNSPNVLRAVETARQRGISTIGFTGRSGGELKDMVDICLAVPVDETSLIQEGHETAFHIICQLVEQGMFR